MTGYMHDRETDRCTAEHDDQSLGAALGRAIGAQVETVATPPLLAAADMADQAAARARVQAARRVGAAVAVSAVLVVGGVIGWNALNRRATTDVIVTATDPSAPGTGTVPATGDPDSAPQTGIEEDAGNQLASASIEEDAGSQLVSAGAEPDDSTGPETPAPQDLSTGPVLQWTEVDPGFVDLFGFESAGDGRVIAYAWPEGIERVVWGERAVVTANGTDWEELRLPDGLIPQEIDIAADRWLVTGRYRSFEAPESRLNRVFFSDDRGTTWTELEFEIPPDPALVSPYLAEHLRVSPALVSGERMVLVLQGYTTVDAQSLLADAGLMPEGKEILGWSDGTSGTVVFDLHDPLETDPESPDFETQHLEVNLEQLGLTEDEWTDLNGPHDDVVRLFTGDGPSVDFVARYTGWVSMGAAIADGFAVTLLDDDNETIITSPDGLVWTETQSFEYRYSPRIVTAGGTIWRTVSEPVGSFSVQRAGYGETPATVATFQGLHPTGVLAAGPAGIAVTAFPSLGGQLEAGAIGGLPMWRDPDRISEPTDVPLWVGWSADGADWGWQSLLDTFGIAKGEAWAQLGIGRDFVIARVETLVAPTPEETTSMQQDPSAYEEYLAAETPPTRWFIARVP